MTNSVQGTTPVRAERSPFLALLVGAVREQRAVLGAAAPFIVGSYVVGPFIGWPGMVGATFWIAQALFMALIVVAGVVVGHRFAADVKVLPAKEAYPAAWRRARESTFTTERVMAYAVVLIVLPLVVACYTGWKAWLGTVLPFGWDAPLMRLDRALHFGYDPWRLLHPILGREWSTDVISLLYESGWAATLHGVITWQALRPPSRERTQFLVASVIAWPLIGNAGAAVFMSAGPCYYQFVVAGANPYEELRAYIHGVNDVTRTLQTYLWRSHETGNLNAVGGGVSAMPSMHLVMATLAAIPLARAGGTRRIVAIAFVAIMTIAAVHLGWHYAVDAYVGIVCAFAVWWIGGLVARKA